MMNPKLLGLAALAMLVTALLFQTMQMEEEVVAEPALPGLKAVLQGTERILIEPLYSDGSKLTLTENDGVWLLEEKGGYPVDFEGLVQFLDKLATAEVIEKKTAKKERHSALGVADQGDEEAAGTRVVVESGGHTFEVIIGKESNFGRGSFVKHPGSDQVYLINKEIAVSANAADWLDAIVINIDSKRVERIEILGSPGLVAERHPENGSVQLKGLPAGAELKYPTIADSLARTLVNLRFDDVLPYDDATFEDAGLSRYRLDSGEEVEVRTVELEDEYWLHLMLSNLTPESELSSYQERSLWQYKISQYVFNEINKQLPDMLKAEEE